MQAAFFDALGADRYPAVFTGNKDAYFLQVGQEAAFAPAAYLAACAAFTFILPLARNQFAGEFAFSANSTFL